MRHRAAYSENSNFVYPENSNVVYSENGISSRAVGPISETDSYSTATSAGGGGGPRRHRGLQGGAARLCCLPVLLLLPLLWRRGAPRAGASPGPEIPTPCISNFALASPL